MKRSVIGLFGRFMNNNVLCSDWLFHSATHQQEGNTGRKIYSQLYRQVIETDFERSVDRGIV